MQNTTETENGESRRPAHRNKKIALGLAALCGAALVAVAIVRESQVSKIVIPPPAPLPKPNAYDFYAKAQTLLGSYPPGVHKKDAPLPLLETTMKSNAPALRAMRQGFAYEYRSPVKRGAPLFRGPDSGTFRDLARRLMVESRVLAARGSWGGAMNSRLDGLRLGSDVSRGGAIIDSLVQTAVETLVRYDAYLLEPHLSAPQARAAARRLEAIFARRVSLAEVLTEEKWVSLTMLRDAFAVRGWRKGLASNPLELFQYYLASPEQIERNYVAMMDAHIANARLPLGAASKPVPPPNNPYTRNFAPVDPAVLLSFARNETGNALLLCNLALRAFRGERGDFPKSLDQLAPSYLQRVPLDPFGNGGKLRYIRNDKNNYWLYSVGPDGRDDRAYSLRAGGYRFTPNARGDIVLGLDPI